MWAVEMELVKYRDWGMTTHTYFWVSKENKVISPYFDTEEEAREWLDKAFEGEKDK